jgi:hypothetical protein
MRLSYSFLHLLLSIQTSNVFHKTIRVNAVANEKELKQIEALFAQKDYDSNSDESNRKNSDK